MTAARLRWGFQVPMLRRRKATGPSRWTATPDVQRDQGYTGQRVQSIRGHCVGDVLEDLLQPQGDEDDRDDDREVQIDVESRARLLPLLALGRRQHMLGDGCHHVEVEPPQAAAMPTPRIEATITAVETGSLATPTPMATSDSPSATMKIRPCRSAKWPGLLSRPPDVPAIQIPA